MTRARIFFPLLTTLALGAQEPGAPDLQSLKQAMGAGQQGAALGQAEAIPQVAPRPGDVRAASAEQAKVTEQERLRTEIEKVKAKEKAPRRFAEDLFKYRQASPTGTDGGVADDYVLGTGDQLQINAYGSATFNVPATVDGRGHVAIPKVGTLKVGGMTLGNAKAAVQAKVAQQFSRTSVDMTVTKLREVRVFVLGEVYLPGSYLVPSLSSLVNVLGLAGGPTAAGSYREIRVVRGGQVVHKVDLYPLRAEGLGNMNFSLQNGDTVFVPLAFNQVTLEGAFTRVVAATGDLLPPKPEKKETKEVQILKERIRIEEAKLAQMPAPKAGSALAQGDETQYKTQGREAGPTPFSSQDINANQKSTLLNAAVADQNGNGGTEGNETSSQGTVPGVNPLQDARRESEELLVALRSRLKELQKRYRGDARLPEDPDRERSAEGTQVDRSNVPGWLAKWQDEGKAPSLQFEMLPRETVQDALRYAGGLAIQSFVDSLTLRRTGMGGVVDALDVPLAKAGQTEMQRGDTLSALSSRERVARVVTVEGWARVPGVYARTEGLKVGDLLRQESQVLPDTYLHRGEIIRTLPDTTSRYLAFDVQKALQGQPEDNTLLEDRDKVVLYRVNDLRLPQTVKVMGPVTKQGTFSYHEGMRASDLLFQAGVPLQEANQYQAELAHTRDGRPSQVIPLDLTKLLSSEASSPVQLKDDAVNPRLQAYDQLSIYAKPDYRPHRTVKISGQVARPGFYTLASDKESLKDLIARAGGLTTEAMPQGTVFLRKIAQVNRQELEGVDAGSKTKDPTSNGINSILERLNETRRQPTTGTILTSPLLHGLSSGNLNRLVVNIPAILSGNSRLDVELQDGDEIMVPRRSQAAYVVGETASPFMTYQVGTDMKVRDLLKVAGGTTRNADESNIRLLKADGRIEDRGVMGQIVEPGDAILVPQRIKRDYSWQENATALANLAVLLTVIRTL